jgi:serine/threonine-protein kinase
VNGFDVLVLPFDLSDPDHPKPGSPQPLASTPANETLPAFSPDGHWLAYASDESGSVEVYVRRVSEPGGKWQVSVGGGITPMWSRTGHEIFYLSPTSNRIMVAEYQAAGDSFVARKPSPWSSVQILSPGFVNADLAPDGKHFAVFPDLEATASAKETVHVTFLLNFFDELKRRAPAAGK